MLVIIAMAAEMVMVANGGNGDGKHELHTILAWQVRPAECSIELDERDVSMVMKNNKTHTAAVCDNTTSPFHDWFPV